MKRDKLHCITVANGLRNGAGLDKRSLSVVMLKGWVELFTEKLK